MSDSLHTSAQLGRDSSRARRREMSRTGAAKIKTDPSSSQTAGRMSAVARRAIKANGAGGALAASVETKPIETEDSPVVAEQQEACCSACADENSSAPCACDVNEAVNSEALDGLCEIVESSPQGSANATSTVRDFCRDRRNTLSKKGKLGLPGKAGRQARKSLMRGAGASSLTGKALARLHREDCCSIGRGDSAACRPSGRVRPDSGSAPPKVEVGTTLSGQSVTGTQVEQTEKITGTESGSCRTVTGTEYLGAELFEKLCASTPSPAAAKVIAGRTGKDMQITGADEARDNAVTGSESGSTQRITGTSYADAQVRKTAAEAPAKVALSHTAAGMSISGGESSRIAGITGDEQDTCHRVTGTEYISNERFQSVCGVPPAVPVAKVGVDASRSGLDITGNLVSRNEKVSGNEPGSCQRVTGSQYAEARADLCDKRSSKVHVMHTLQGGTLTGTEASPSPKLTGDDRGSCSGVTGSEYISQEYFEQTCSQTPVPSAKKTGMSHTWGKQLVSGTQTGHSEKVTGNEQGICKTITGSGYAAREQVGEFCTAPAVAQSEQRLGQHAATPALPISGIGPSADERLAGNFQRGICQDITGTPYQSQQGIALCQTNGLNKPQSKNVHHLAQAPIDQVLPVAALTEAEKTPYQADFSVVSPAQAAWQQGANKPVHSSVSAAGGLVTGVVNKAEGIISGTPEFRHQQLEPGVTAVAVTAPVAVQRGGITGEGSEAGTSITGDDWSRGGSVTGTEGMFSAQRNQTQRGTAVARDNIGAHALKDRERPEVSVSRVTGGSGNTAGSAAVTLSGGAGA